MKITKKELREMIKESINKNSKINSLNARKKEIEEQLGTLYENEELAYGGAMHAPVVSQEQPAEEAEEQPKESIFDSKPGETVIMNFEGVTLKIERQLDDLFKVVDAAESKKLKEGDYVKIQGNDSLENGKSYTFSIYRQTPLKYETNPLQSWKIIKN